MQRSDNDEDQSEHGEPKRRRRAGSTEDRQKRTGRAGVYVPIDLAPTRVDGKTPRHAPEARLAEALGLAAAIDLEIVASGIIPLRQIRPGTLIGTGKVEEIKAAVAEHHLDLVIFDHALSPVQQRNLEKALSAKVLDRTGLILEIFGERARTKEGRLQVELAHLVYQKSRLVRSWTHLERQRGGAGFLGGPGETQIELDKRMLQERIEALEEDLEKVKRTRELHRVGRRQVPYPIVALVGYTNAGKSTLFNAITGAGVLAKDLLFATLDPTMREVRLVSGRRMILADTVGFISELPTMLIAAFRATLEEVLEADIILHVRDIADAESEAQRGDVLRVLEELGIEVEGPGCPIIEVWNKTDLLAPERREMLCLQAAREQPPAVLVSSVSGDGVDALLAAIDARMAVGDDIVSLEVAPAEGRLLAWLHDNTEVLERSSSEEGQVRVRVRVDPTRRGRLMARLEAAGEERARILRPG